MNARPIRAGDLVEVRSAAEILATLDANGELGALPFMPEMLSFLGRRFRVDRRAEKICDTINYTGSRQLKDTVMLADLRCDGASHGGCQAECRFFWKEAWLKRVAPGDPAPPPPSGEASSALVERIGARTTRTVDAEGRAEVRYVCQATELPRATEHLATFDPRPYLREFTCGNVSFGKFVRVTARAAIEEPMRKLGLIPEVPVPGTLPSPVQPAPLGLQPGDWIQVKSRAEIAETLNAQGRNRGLWFDREMLPFCGGTFRVRRRVTRFIDDHNGKMVELKNECVTLDGAVCSGDRSLRRWFCPREIYPYWREGWLRRVEPPAGAQASGGDAPGRGGGEGQPTGS